MASINPLRYRGYYYDQETGLYFLMSRYYDPAICRFINADSFASTGQGILGYNMFAYCLNNPVNWEDLTGMYSYNKVTQKQCDFGCSDYPPSRNYIPYTVSVGSVFAVGLGSLSISLQLALVTDSAGTSEIQISYSAPNIFSSGLPSTDQMLADITSDSPKFRFGASLAGTVTFTNAPSVSKLYGSSYSVGGAVSGIAVDYNAIPIGDGSDEIYSGITLAGGMITPGFNVSMSNTILGFAVPFSVFDVIEAMYNGVYGR